MTTIAWDGKTVATDSQSTSGSMKAFNCKKAFNPGLIPFYDSVISLIACSGTDGDERHILKYLREGDLISEKEMHREIECTALIMLVDGRSFTMQKDKDNSLPWIYENQCPYAIGSGRDFAMAAMTLGKNAAEAVELAKQLDAYTGGDVICYEYKREG